MITGAEQAAENLRFVGRHAELAHLRALLAAAAAGSAQTAVLRGPPGIGKSTLLRQVRDLARDPVRGGPPAVVLVAAEPAEATLAYGLLSTLLTALGGPAGSYTAVAASADPFTVGLRLLEALGGRQACRTLLIDDVQFADPLSLRALLFALRRLQNEPVLAVLTLRTGEPAPEDLSRFVERPETVRLTMTGLDLDATAALCATLTPTPLAPATVARLQEATAGNPLWLTAAAADPDRLGEERPGEPLPPPAGYAELVRRQLDECAADVRTLAVAVAVAGPAPLRYVAPVYAAAGGDTGGARWPDAVTREAVEARFLAPVTAGAENLRPYHGLTASAVYWSVPAGLRAALHRAAAQTADPDRRLDHRCAADAILGDDPDLAADLDTRATRLRRAGDFVGAARLGLAAAERGVDEDARAALRTEAGLDFLRAGDLDRAAQVADLATPAAESAESATSLALRGALALLRGRPAEANRLLRRGFDAAGENADLAGLCASQLTALSVNFGDGDETLRWARRSAALIPGDATTQLMLHAAEGVLADGPGPWPETDAPVSALAGTLTGRGVQWLWRGDDAAARRELQDGLDLALRDGPIVVALIAGYYLTEALYRLGELQQALAVSTTNLSLAHDAEMPWTWTLAHGTRVAPLVALGRLTEATEHAQIAAASNSGDVAAVLWAACAEARIALAESRPQDAVGALAVMDQHRDAAGARNPAVQPWQLLQAQALLDLDRPAEADDVLAPIEDSLAGWQRPWVGVQVARLRGACARARGDHAAAAEILAGAVTDLGPNPSWESAVLRAECGALLRRRGRRAAAQTQLHAARERLAAMGAPTALVDDEIAALDGSGGDGLLTRRERVVAELVAEGATNKEIAESLHLSVKTVEFHLGRAFAKLQIRSRGGVAQALARQDAATD